MSLVETNLENEVLTITLNDEENRNALSAQLTTELIEAIDEADTNPNVRVVVLTNSGKVFCAGADLAERSSEKEKSSIKPVDPALLFGRFQKSPKPYVGRIAGHCVAGGMGLAASMDISIADETVKFGFTEVRIGVAPAVISVVCLPKMRQAEAKEAFLRGNRFLATEAVRMGLINSAVPANKLDDAVKNVVADLKLGGPEAIAATKQLTSQVSGMASEEAFQWTGELSKKLFLSEEAAEGMRAYLDKRPPSWAKKR